MNMRNFILVLLLFAVNLVYAQEQKKIEIRGKIFNSVTDTLLEGVSVSADNMTKSELTDNRGEFVLSVNEIPHHIIVKYPGFHEEQILLYGRTSLSIYLIPLTIKGYPEEIVLPLKKKRSAEKTGISSVVSVDETERGHIFVDELMAGTIPGIRALQKSGMPGEGNFLSLRGTHSLIGQNTPLIVMDGMPVLTDQNLSLAFTGYSRNLLNTVSIKELSDITVVKGYDAAVYGSAASNGVILVNTEHALDMDTRVEVETVNGVSFVGRTLSLLNGDQFRQYLTRLGLTQYKGDELLEAYPFLKNGSKDYTYKNSTDWQKEIFKPAFTTENLLKVKGGDAVAKYALMGGYLNTGGIMDGSKLSRYFLRFNGDMQMSRKVSMFTNMSFNYLQSVIHEQGMVPEVNPLLAAILKPAIEGPYKRGTAGQELSVWAPIDLFRVSNPAMLAREVTGENNQYETLVNLGVNYDIGYGLSLKGLAGIHYSYATDKFFIPGVSTESILPLEGGRAENTVRDGVSKAFTYYGNIALNYEKTFRKDHELTANAGAQLLRLNRLYEFAKGLNTATDYNQNISSVKDASGKNLSGYDNLWTFGNYYLNVAYAFRKQLYAGISVSADASSVTGENSALFNFYPSANLAWRMKGAPFLRNFDFVSDLTLRAEFSRKGNAMMPPMLGEYYYEGTNFESMGGIVRGNIPNDKLAQEYVDGVNFGLDFATQGRKFAIAVDWFRDETKDMVVRQDLGDAFGSKFRYINSGRMINQGIELSVNAVALRKGNFEWALGATLSRNKAEIKALGGSNESVITLTDGGQIITRVGESPYAFYGLQAEGVFSTTAEAEAADLKNYKGLNYAAGDMHFMDQNKDGVINQDDRVILGDATPDFYGGFYTSFRYKNFTLNARFTYSYGNDIYNAVRRQGESMKDYFGQTQAVLSAWRYEGQQTDVPRAVYGDPMGNSTFSSRWIEDGSYLKLKNLTLNYEYPNKLWIFRKVQAYLSADNLITWTKYLGCDLEFAYSYDHYMLGVDYGKVPGATTFKLGIRLGF